MQNQDNSCSETDELATLTPFSSEELADKQLFASGKMFVEAHPIPSASPIVLQRIED